MEEKEEDEVAAAAAAETEEKEREKREVGVYNATIAGCDRSCELRAG